MQGRTGRRGGKGNCGWDKIYERKISKINKKKLCSRLPNIKNRKKLK